MQFVCCRNNLFDGPLEFEDILPENPKDYDKMQPPKEEGEFYFLFLPGQFHMGNSLRERDFRQRALFLLFGRKFPAP